MPAAAMEQWSEGRCGPPEGLPSSRLNRERFCITERHLCRPKDFHVSGNGLMMMMMMMVMVVVINIAFVTVWD